MRFLAVDVGDKRTGFAAGDDMSGVVTPIGAEIVSITVGGDLSRLISIVLEQAHAADADVVAVGLPLNMDGSVGPRAEHARRIASAIAKTIAEAQPAHKRTNVVLVDERKTSEVADSLMARSGLTHGQKKKKRDALAAMAIGWVFLEQGATEQVQCDPEQD